MKIQKGTMALTIEKPVKRQQIEAFEMRDNSKIEDFEIWDEITSHIDRSNIRRYNWKLIFGESLSKHILRYKMQGLNATETYQAILEDPIIEKITKFFPDKAKRLKEKLKISVHARFGENNTALKLFNEEFKR
jgi:hypothetical protein